MANRYIPFGYQITEGTIAVIPEEARLVTAAFEQYNAGKSYSQIAERFTLSGIPYREGTNIWNKNMVKRMLENSRYIGADGYPPIIDQRLFQKANGMREDKKARVSQEKADLDKLIRQHTVCGLCGSLIKRKKYGSQNSYTVVQCVNPECERLKPIREDYLHQVILDKLNGLIENIDMAVPDKSQPIVNSLAEIEQRNNELYAHMADPGRDRGELLEEILGLAQYKFSQCQSTDMTAVTQKIQRILCGYPKQEKLSVELMQEVISRIYLHENKIVEIELKNGKRI